MAADRMMMMMNWDGMDDDDEFFESRERMSCAVTLDMASSGSDDDEYDDSRISFSSAISGATTEAMHSFRMAACAAATISHDYDIWMTEPSSIKDRRQRLLQGMGLSADKELLRVTSKELRQSTTKSDSKPESLPSISISPSPLPPTISLVTRSRSEGCVYGSFASTKERKEHFVGDYLLRKRLIRSSSVPSSFLNSKLKLLSRSIQTARQRSRIRSLDTKEGQLMSLGSMNGSSFLIKNLDTGKVFLINEDGTSSSLSDLQTGKQLTMEEFEKCVGHSPIVKELMRRENVGRGLDDSSGDERKISNAFLTKSFRSSKRRGAGWLKNIKGVANSLNGLIIDRERERERDTPSLTHQQSNVKPSKWTKVHQHGKSSKDLTGLYMCQEIQAHQGSIWTIRFSSDAKYLASAGEDRVIHIWEVMDCDVYSSKTMDDASSTPLHPMAMGSPDRIADGQLLLPERKKKGKVPSIRKNRSVPEYVVVPETVFSLSERPVCTFEGHLDDVLDLSWSKSQQLLSSSMDKTVRLWDMESKTCLKLFAHNDYVTCIQFNPVDDSYFISGSLDAKVRIWSTPERKVVDWTDLHEMVTAVCYTPDGQGALVGTHKGGCRLYNTSDCKLNQKGQIDVQNKKKSQAKKITGFQFAPGNASEVLITSADSRIRIFDGSDVTYKFTGFRNTSSQISASFTLDGKYVVCASEDSQVYVWKRDEYRNLGGGKGRGLVTTRSYERFQCRDVSVAIPWPGTIKYEQPVLALQSKRHSKYMQPAFSPWASAVQDRFQPPSASAVQDAFNASTRKNLPPLPKKNGVSDRTEDDFNNASIANSARTESGIGESARFISAPGSASSSFRYGDSPLISASDQSYSSISWMFESENNNNIAQQTAWGLVVVTAGLGGEIRIYQNFGLPLRLSRQTNLFRDYI